ncbi:Extracellular ribonuclease [Bienertia sinuspersici]
MLSIPLIVTPTFPRIKTTQFQQFNNKKFSSIISYNYYPLKFGNCRDSSFCSTKFSSISRVFLKWIPFNGTSSKLASCIISIYLLVLLALNPETNAQEHSSFLARYACEDVNSYYASIGNLKGKALSRKLNSIIAGHHSLSYKEVWDALKILDAADLDEPKVSSEILFLYRVEIYSGRVVPKRLAGKPEGWNREHLWPRSYGLVHGPSLTDLHNIRPADVNVNSSRGNKYFGECQVGSKRCMKPANKEAASDTETDVKIWAPPTRVRGDIARAVMYMAVRYGFHQPANGPVLRLSDSPSMVKKKMGLLSILLKWNELDPPSREEKLRNERVCRLYQHNRNPFVDHPEYANLIWKQDVLNPQDSSPSLPP